MSSIITLNDYTLLETTDNDKIFFYPIYAITNTKIKKKKNDVCVLFEIRKEKYTSLFNMNCSLIDEEGKTIFNSYSIDLKCIEPNKYVVITNKKDILHAEILPKEIIDFNALDYNTFITILKENQELAKMIPELTKTIKRNMESLQSEKKVAKKIDIPSPTHYFQNITGYEIDRLENQITTEEELDISTMILKNVKKNFEVVLYEESQSKLSYLALYALILNKVKSISMKPKAILDTKERKLDTNKVSLTYNDLDSILNSFMDNLKEAQEENFERNIIQERIEYVLTSKPTIKEFKNFIKVIVAADQYIEQTKRNRIIDEEKCKNLLISSLANQTYRPLPRNQVLIYNLVEENTVDFICIISLDKLYELLKTYRCNSVSENKKGISLLKELSSMIENKPFHTSSKTIEIVIYILLMMNLYYYKNSNSNIELFNKGDYILKLDYRRGDFDIKVIHRQTEKQYGHFIKLTEETEEKIKASLDKNEKTFIRLMNKIVYQNLEACLKNIDIEVKYHEIANRGIQIKLNRTLKKDIYDMNTPLYVLLSILTSVKIPSTSKLAKEPIVEENQIQEDENTKCGLPIEEYEYIVRKSNTITQIMLSKPVENKIYQKIATLYQKFPSAEKQTKAEILLELKALLNEK